MTKMVDVAKHAGVSVKTVSRVLNNEPYVQEALRKRVRESVAELGYVPSASARSLRSRRTYRIHLISHSDNSSFVHAIQFGALKVGQEAGYQTIVSMLDPARIADPEFVDSWLDQLCKAGKPDGVILVPPLSENAAFNTLLARRKIPVARIGPNRIEDTNATVMIDDREAARVATNHLLELGHTRIGFVRGKEDQGATERRFKGYRDALYGAGIDLDPELVKKGAFDFETGRAAGEAFLDMDTPPTAVFASNDDMAAGVLVAAHMRGVAVPDALSVVGFDDSELATKMWPALTSVRQPLMDYGAKAMDVLVNSAGKKDGPGALLQGYMPFELVVRGSSAAPGS